MCFFLHNWVLTIWCSRVQPDMRAELPSRKLLTQVWRQLSRLKPLNNIIGTDTSPMFTGKIAVSQRFLNTIRYLLGSFFLLYRA